MTLNLLGPLCAFLSSVTWAVGSAHYSKLSSRYSPFAVNFSRALFALPLFLIFAGFTSGGALAALGQFKSLEWSHWGWFTLSMIASYGLGDAFFLWSTRELGVPGALAIASSYPIWTALVGASLGDPLSATQIIGLLITVAGVGVVILAGAESLPKARVRGIFLGVVTSFFWATNSFALSRGSHGVDVAIGNAVRMVLALFLTWGFRGAFDRRSDLVLPFKEVRRYAWIFGLEAFGGSAFFMYGLSHSPLAIAATLSSLAPVLSVPIAWLLRLEKFSWYRTVGIIFVVCGVWLLLGIVE